MVEDDLRFVYLEKVGGGMKVLISCLLRYVDFAIDSYKVKELVVTIHKNSKNK